MDPHGKKLGLSLQNELRRVYDVLLADFTSDGSQGIYPSNLSPVPPSKQIDSYPNANAVAVEMAQLGINSVKAASHLPNQSQSAPTTPNHKEATQKISQQLIENALTPPRPHSSSRSITSPNRSNTFGSPVGALRDATSMIESEFNQLNTQYVSLLNSVKSGEEEDIGAMLNLISNIQSKGEQLNIMKQTMQNKNVRMPVFSPEVREAL